MKKDNGTENDPKLLDHNYDGIQELDNPLPTWWLMTFYGAIVIGVGYFAYYQIFGGPTLRDEYHQSLQHHKVVKDAYLEELTEFNPEKFDEILTQPEMVAYGKNVFQANCVSCHASEGAGDIGPNLTDKYWLFANGNADTIYPFLITGSPAAGMPAWGEFLEEDELYSVLAYIMSIQGKEHLKAKAPQGALFENGEMVE